MWKGSERRMREKASGSHVETIRYFLFIGVINLTVDQTNEVRYLY